MIKWYRYLDKTRDKWKEIKCEKICHVAKKVEIKRENDKCEEDKETKGRKFWQKSWESRAIKNY